METHGTYTCWLPPSAAAPSSCCLPSPSLSVHPFLSCPANYPRVPIKCSRHLFGPTLHLYQCRRHLSISHLQGNGKYLCTCVLHTINAAPLIKATLLTSCRVTDPRAHAKNTAHLSHANTNTQTRSSEQNTTLCDMSVNLLHSLTHSDMKNHTHS